MKTECKLQTKKKARNALALRELKYLFRKK